MITAYVSSTETLFLLDLKSGRYFFLVNNHHGLQFAAGQPYLWGIINAIYGGTPRIVVHVREFNFLSDMP